MLFDSLTLSLAQAPAAQAGAGATLMSLLPILLMFVVLYFLMIRPQMKRQKAHRELIAALAVGDEVLTAGGIMGRIVRVRDTYVTLSLNLNEEQAVVLRKTEVIEKLPNGTLKETLKA